MSKTVLEFEKPIHDLEQKIIEMEIMSGDSDVDMKKEIKKLRKKLVEQSIKITKNLSRWQRVELARHADRPHALDLIDLMCDSWVELHGDRLFGDDKAIVSGIARIGEQRMVIIGQQKGRSTKDNLYRNFGMPYPEGYRKALRHMKLAEKYRIPVVTLVDTIGAYPGLEAEERGQAEAIARNLFEMSHLSVPIIVIVIGEGASGGALGIGVGDRLIMLENTWYSVISPEGCASILYRDATQKKKAAEAMRVTAKDLLEMGIADRIIDEPLGGAHRDYKGTAKILKEVILEELDAISGTSVEEMIEKRIHKIENMGAWEGE
ncbi:MAG: acetyl-CoA carboxylase carboxyltransferase subunit alpha [Candidatus Marinimicrobia bacterium]|jgi:acetyl-CoA carboxylase carboxyl transferase subunit alpha|nr:acetyl-CoA carboxylase carboxyltransferase subunit alpha [Candidatus Neomarinimicrobiota bacterium]MBT4361462.1 acetyl-CoA carboxylase carboxyltransferase subunit alpha [Candidatus Neomarinimicrobiota bacterium]MBT4713702.1 acetyl-CoA carboxylase carboxyltransferase subunit alpha [Candidatus Neomarinimicrobiota bacterium]MBT4947556.1 acetyl-CoA carboxylase carboxyltransferase subunit alpha [Candidatus Neomarinimicrobiota bacterium]MBT5268001.1 acetyl-CoA carboxylase carboxyltransferase subun